MRCLLIGLLVPVCLSAQVTSCSLSGTVQDAVGAVIPGALITLTDQANGFVRTVNTTNNGFFTYPDLTPGTFTLAVEAKGFKMYRQTGIPINADEQRSLGEIKLEVGQVSESVTVAAEVTSVDLASGERAGTLTGQQLDEIALRGRDIFDAVSLMPGVVDTTDGRDSPSPTSIGGIYIMGGRNDQKNMTIDGVTNLDTGSNTSVHSMPSMDSVAGVKVLLAAYSAENGRNPFAINVITRGGTKDFHGMASYYFRNEDLNANDFFSNEAGRARPEYRYNIGSWTIGGPVILPRLHSLRNKLFFFFSQEFQRQVVNYGVKEITVPTAAMRQGDFSQAYTSAGVLIPVRDPNNLVNNSKQQFPGNIVPASRLTTGHHTASPGDLQHLQPHPMVQLLYLGAIRQDRPAGAGRVLDAQRRPPAAPRANRAARHVLNQVPPAHPAVSGRLTVYFVYTAPPKGSLTLSRSIVTVGDSPICCPI